MKKIFLLLIVVVLSDAAFGQFRNRNKNKNTTTSEELDYSNPQEYEIANIKVQGINVLDENALISLTGLKEGDRIRVPGDDISGAIRKLWKHGLVGDVSIFIEKPELGKINVIIELTERARLTGFTFEGINKAREADLRDNLNLIRGRVLSDAIIRNAEITVKKHFVDKGFLNTEVKVIREADSLNREGVKLRIMVNKKAKVKIKDIKFEGNNDIDGAKLKKKMKSTNEKVRFTIPEKLADAVFGFNPKKTKEFVTDKHDASWKDVKKFVNDNIKLNFFNSSKFVRTDFEDDKKVVINYYNSKGYRDAEITADTLYSVDVNKINIALKVDEGRKYYFRNIEWTGNYIHTDEILNKILDVEKGDVYNMELINRKLSFNPKGPDISGLYMDDGYLFFNVRPIEVGIVGDSIDVEMRIYEGEQATINKIIISGNDRTNDHVILRELTTLPGQKFSRSELIRSQQRLSQLGYFDPEQVNPNPIPNQTDGTVDIEWSVVERPSDQVQLSGGWGGSFGFVGTLGLTFNNFSIRNIPHMDKWRPLPIGDGQRLSLSLQANGKQFQSYNFSFTEPWLGGRKPNSFSVSFNRSIQRQAFSEDLDFDGTFENRSFTDFNAKLSVTGVTIGLGRRLNWPDNNFILSNSIAFLEYGLENYTSRDLGITDGNANSFVLNTTLSRSSIDNPMFPSSGSSVSLNLALTPPYSIFRDKDWWKLDNSERDNIRSEVTQRIQAINSEAPDIVIENEVASEISNRENSERYKWIEYHKWMFDAKHYLTLAGKLVLESSVHAGFIGSYSKNTGIGPFERFYLGGDGLAGQNFLLGTEIVGMRGYTNNAITPPFDIADGNSGIRGGIVYNKYSFELRYPITTGQAATIYVFGFGEAGNNWYNYDEVNPFQLYKTAGFGARIFMPAFGLIGLNWGYGFDTLPGQTQISGPQFHFTIGQQLR